MSAALSPLRVVLYRANHARTTERLLWVSCNSARLVFGSFGVAVEAVSAESVLVLSATGNASQVGREAA